MSTLYPVILAGGGGTRLWPLSREHFPKQYLSFADTGSMLQQSLQRIQDLHAAFPIESPVIICNEEHRFLVAEHARQIGIEPKEMLLEPAGRNTAPALTIAALRASDTDTVLLMMPSDHYIRDTAAFHAAITAGYEEAVAGKLVTLGIRPVSAETGYGYIHATQRDGSAQVYDVERFVEKPDQDTALHYLKAGDYYWNSGIFMMQASVWLAAMNAYSPDILESCSLANETGIPDGQFFHLPPAFADCRSDSIDYAVMEKATSADSSFELAMVPLDAGWSDLGSWSALWDISMKDRNDNAISGDVITEDTTNSIIQSHSRLVAVIGGDDLLVIETADAVLVGKRSDSQSVKKIVGKLQESGRVERIEHRRVYRPWGSYESLDVGKGFQVKRLIVNPGKKLSLQLHHQRAEHWVVVSGIATVTRGEETFDLHVNESTFLPLGIKHRLENRQESILEVIEVQSGNYLGEDDIVRFDDDFGRQDTLDKTRS